MRPEVDPHDMESSTISTMDLTGCEGSKEGILVLRYLWLSLMFEEMRLTSQDPGEVEGADDDDVKLSVGRGVTGALVRSILLTSPDQTAEPQKEFTCSSRSTPRSWVVHCRLDM